MTDRPPIEFPALLNRLQYYHRFNVLFGGRGSGKSHSVALHLLVEGLKADRRILCCREYQTSISQSVHQLLCDINDEYGLGYTYTRDTLTHPITGTTFLFAGLKSNPEALTSAANITDCWIEEAAKISTNSWEKLLPTIRAEGSQFYIVFNPASESDPVYIDFVRPFLHSIKATGRYVGTMPGVELDGVELDTYWVQEINYLDNWKCPSSIISAAAQMKVIDPQKFLHVYMGQAVKDLEDAVFSGEWIDACMNFHKTEYATSRGYFDAHSRTSFGYDPSNGVDAQALVRREGYLVKDLKLWHSDLGDGCRQVHQTVRAHGADNLTYDVVGLGTGVNEILSSMEGAKTYERLPFNGANSPEFKFELYKGDLKNADVFKNRRAQHYTLLADRMRNTFNAHTKGIEYDEEDLISFDTATCENLDQLRLELVGMKRVVRAGKSLIQIESKQDMKKRGVASPNLADALVYAFAGQLDNSGDFRLMPVESFARWI